MNQKRATLVAILFLTLISFLITTKMVAQDNSAYINLLLKKNLITQREADSIATLSAFNQKVSSENKSFNIGSEFRPRMEYRDGYKQLPGYQKSPTDPTDPAYFVSQRSRLYFTYCQSQFKFHTSIQDVRVWGQYGQTSTTGSLSVFEAYVDAYISEHFLVRLGRQKFELDNGRLFSQANWSQAGRAHDGIDFVYNSNTINSEFLISFNQTAENIYGTTLGPAYSNYKMLGTHYLKAKLDDHFSLTTINSADGLESKTNPKTMYTRATSGGRIEYEKGNLYLTLAGYYQYGQIQAGNHISAYYFQPEIQLKNGKLTTRFGMEYMSGDNAEKPSNLSKSFVPLYGVAWKFMGNLDYFTTFPADTKNGGLINPYLFFNYDLNKKLSIRSDYHLFYSQNKVKNADKEVINPYLGFENDISLKYKYNSITTIDFGLLGMLATKSMEVVKGGGNSCEIPVSSYLMITFKPELFSSKK